MTLRQFAPEEQLEELEAAIAMVRTGQPCAPGAVRRRMDVLRSLASDLRARQPESPGDALAELQRRIDDLLRSKTHLGFSRDALVGLGQELVGRWPTVKLALENLDGGER